MRTQVQLALSMQVQLALEGTLGASIFHQSCGLQYFNMVTSRVFWGNFLIFPAIHYWICIFFLECFQMKKSPENI